MRIWVTQPRHQSLRLGNKRFYGASREAHNFYCLYEGTRTPLFHPRLLLPCPSILAHSSASAQVLIFSAKPFQTCPEREASGWSSLLRGRTLRSSGKPDT